MIVQQIDLAIMTMLVIANIWIAASWCVKGLKSVGMALTGLGWIAAAMLARYFVS